MALFQLRYDLRCPAFARATSAALAEAAIEQCAHADRHGFVSVVLSEHHGSPDGYLPSPLVLAAAIAARTQALRLVLAAVVAPLHDPIRLAEDLAVLDVVSKGRVVPVLAAGYVAAEFRAFGRELRQRGRLLEEAVRVLERAWTGEPFEHGGRAARVTPRPVQRPRPPILLGGSTPAAARRAARIADGFVPSTPELMDPFRAERRRLGKPDPGPAPATLPGVVHLADDPDAAWRRIAPHALHEASSYAAWLREAGLPGPYREFRDADEIRASGEHLVLTPEELIARLRPLDPATIVTLHPLVGGLDPEVGWESLRLVTERVLPALSG